MPIIWRYLLSQYLKVLTFCTAAFIAVLLTTRLDEIAHFATLGASGAYIALYTMYQVPYVLPIAIPISGLISTIILIQRLSHTYELTALRSAGMAIRDILAPILLAAACLTVLNFYIVSELATHSHMSANSLKTQLRSINPLLLLHNKHLMRLKGFYFDSMGPSRLGEFATDVIVTTPNKHNRRLNLMLAKTLMATPQAFVAKGVTLITSVEPKENEERYDQLAIENIAQATTSIQDFSQMVEKKILTLHNDHLRLPLLLVRLQEENRALALALADNKPLSEQKQICRSITRCYTEIVRRISVALATFTFTLMGAAFGISISRNRSNKGLFLVIGLAALYIVSYFAAKGIDHHLIAASLLYIVPHILIMILSILSLRRVSKGIE